MSSRKAIIRINPHGRVIPATVGSSVLEALLQHSIFLRTDCGGKGSCGKCQVLQGLDNGTEVNSMACQLIVSGDLSITIPESSLLSAHIMSKAPASLPESFREQFAQASGREAFGLAVDLGTTTIAVYLCNTANGAILASVSVKNPQTIYGDDVMSRISAISQETANLSKMQGLVVRAIQWAIGELRHSLGNTSTSLTGMVAVGNPTMIHILAGIDPQPIGVAPYQPVFHDAVSLAAKSLGLSHDHLAVRTLPQVSGFIGGDILAAALAVELASQPEGTLLIDLGTNGELLLKGKDAFYATSCATGPAFEGASLSCGMQAIPGAINAVNIGVDQKLSSFTMIEPEGSQPQRPTGICGAGIINAVAQFCTQGIIAADGKFTGDRKLFILVPENRQLGQSSVHISQKDIRSVQLGKAALLTGIEFLLARASCQQPTRIIIAGAFGSYLKASDLMRLGIIPAIAPDRVESVGNAAGAGAVMALCAPEYIEQAKRLAAMVEVVELAGNATFQERFVDNLRFPEA